MPLYGAFFYSIFPYYPCQIRFPAKNRLITTKYCRLPPQVFCLSLLSQDFIHVLHIHGAVHTVSSGFKGIPERLKGPLVNGKEMQDQGPYEEEQSRNQNEGEVEYGYHSF